MRCPPHRPRRPPPKGRTACRELVPSWVVAACRQPRCVLLLLTAAIEKVEWE